MSYIDLSEYQYKKQRIMELLARLRNAFIELGNAEDIVAALSESLHELDHHEFHLVVIGEFSRGKSTFINALLGARVLPSSAKPTTAILNLIHYRDHPHYELIYRNGEPSRHVDEQQFKSIVAPLEPLGGEELEEHTYVEQVNHLKQIQYANIGYPVSFLKDQVVIVDTPGTNDLDAEREEITYQFIPKSDAAIFVLSARQILSDSEMQFLKNRILQADIQKIFFVINFKDALASVQEQEKILNYAREKLSEVLPEPKLYLISAKHGLLTRRASNKEEVKGTPLPIEESGIPAFEQALSSFLARERGPVKLQKPVKRAMRLATEAINNHIALERVVLSLELEQLTKAIADIEPKISAYERSVAQIMDNLEKKLQLHGQEMKDHLKLELTHIAGRAVTATQEYAGELSREAFLAAIEQTVAPLQSRLQEQLQAKQEECLLKEGQAAYARYQREWGELESRYIQSFQLASAGGDNHQVAVFNPEQRKDLPFVQNPDNDPAMTAMIGVGGAATLFLISSVLFLPVALGGIFLLSMFKEKKRQQALAKLRVQVESRFLDQIPAMIKQFEQQWNVRSGEMVAGIGKEMRRKSDGLRRNLDTLLEEKRLAESNTAIRQRQLDGIEQEIRKLYVDLENCILE